MLVCLLSPNPSYRTTTHQQALWRSLYHTRYILKFSTWGFIHLQLYPRYMDTFFSYSSQLSVCLLLRKHFQLNSSKEVKYFCCFLDDFILFVIHLYIVVFLLLKSTQKKNVRWDSNAKCMAKSEWISTIARISTWCTETKHLEIATNIINIWYVFFGPLILLIPLITSYA